MRVYICRLDDLQKSASSNDNTVIEDTVNDSQSPTVEVSLYAVSQN